MRVLWAPWRLSYVEKPESNSGCIFCDKPRLGAAEARRRDLVLRVTEQVSVILNLFPYSNGHVLVAPREHTSDFGALDASLASALQAEVQRVVRVLTRAFAPAGFNVGMNLGRPAGAGIAEHLHWHVVPRWIGDTNFMPVFADIRVIPEHLEATYDRLLPLFAEEA